MSTPRELTYQSWDDVRHDLQTLLQGYQKQGHWNLAQAALHLNDWVRFSMDGYPPVPWPLRAVLVVVRPTLGKSLVRRVLKRGFPHGAPALPSTVYQVPDSEARRAVEQLLGTIDRFEQFTGPIAPSPLFGSVDKATAQQLHLRHCAHHLRLLIPTAVSS